MTVAGIGWYKKEQWEHLQRISTDKENLESTWEEWAQKAERTLLQMTKNGHIMKKVPVDVAELELWCRTKSRQCDGPARAQFITETLKRSHE